MSTDKSCFLCSSTNTNSARSIFSPSTGILSAKSLASTLADILQQNIDENVVHSKYLCKKCIQQCKNFELLSERIESLRMSMIVAYNDTVERINADNADVEKDESMQIVDYDGSAGASSTIEDTYTMEDVNFDEMAKVLSEDGNVIVTGADGSADKASSVRSKNIVFVDPDDMKIFTMSEMNNIVQSEDSQDSAFQAVIFEQTEEDEYSETDGNEQYFITEHLDDGKEYFDANEDQMIEVSTNGDVIQEDKSADYEPYVYQDESNEDTIGDDVQTTDLMITRSIDDSSSQEMLEMKDDSNGKLSNLGKSNARTTKTRNSGNGNRILFVRDGMQFKCALCDNDVLYDTKTIAIHLKTDHNERIYVCGLCGRDFQKRNPYSEHMEAHMSNANDGSYECETCKQVFTNMRQYRLHMKIHTFSSKIWTCKECNKSYSSKNLLEEHINMHTGERPYKCPHCVKDFASKYTLTSHMKIHYDRKRPFECKICGKSFFSNQNLTQHERTHSGIKEFECDVCHKKFGTPHNLDVHKIVHTGYKPFICRTCGKAFARRAEIKDHERTHTGERPYKCDMCNSSFAQRSNLMSHKRATHFNDKRYKCESCDRSFKRRRLLEYHIKATHTGERPYKCDVCNATFVYPEHFKKHVRIHSGVKPFVCEVCGKAFNSRDNRNAHRYVHSDKKPYECIKCGVGFMRKPLLYAHMEATNHVNDTIIINQPHISEKADKSTASENDDDSINDADIVYLNLKDSEDPLDVDEYTTFEDKSIIEVNDQLIIDGQVQLVGERELTTTTSSKHSATFATQQKLATHIEGDVDPLQLVQICVPSELHF